MGGKKSKPADKLSLLDEPWRKINWGDNQRTLQYVNDFKPLTEGQQIKILLYGLVGAGKSSFVNSANSVLNDRIFVQALAANIGGDSFTKKLTTYKIQKGHQNTFYPFVFNDMKGLTNRNLNTVLVNDMRLVLKGHVKDGYEFKADRIISDDDQYYNPSPTLNDKVHVLVCVVDANTALVMEEGMKAIRNIRVEASELGIPQVALLTKIDNACPEIRGDVMNIYKSETFKKKMEQLSANLGIPMNCIFPVKNYHEEIDIDEDINALILSALKHIVNFGGDFLNHTNAKSA